MAGELVVSTVNNQTQTTKPVKIKIIFDYVLHLIKFQSASLGELFIIYKLLNNT